MITRLPVLRFAARGPSAERKEFFSFADPALMPQLATRLGNVLGYYRASRQGRD